MAEIRGLNCRLYYSPDSGTTWSTWNCVKDVTVSLSLEEVDASCRGSGGFRLSATTFGALEVSGNAIKNKSDTSFLAFEAAAISKSPILVQVTDGDRTVSGTSGWEFESNITEWSENQPFEGIVEVDFTMKPAHATTAPQKFDIP